MINTEAISGSYEMTAATTAATTRGSVAFTRLLRAELRWIFRRPRNLMMLGVLPFIPIAVGISLLFAEPSTSPHAGPGSGLLPAAVDNAFALPIAVIVIALTTGMPLTAAMAGADALAGEAAHGTLRGWLLAPVSRGRLLAVKAAGVAVVVLAATLPMALSGFAAGLVMFGTHATYSLSGSSVTFWAALGQIMIAVVWVTLQLLAVGAVALAISACTDHPLIVVIAVLGGTALSTLLTMLSPLDWLHPFLLTESWNAVGDVLRDPMPTDALLQSVLCALCYIGVGLSLAYLRLKTKDS
ncbi:ABC transporter permease subunit [Nocardia suismassiliense]|uniref:ABC transporter permease subunit n=1 Tax=Nocardia suismassiliense TaxID=2077092 RepID=UPI001F3B5AFE|nr:ABC transporter permease subunit [Nocardia suismassiliense]